MTQISSDDAKKALNIVAQTIVDNKQYLSDIDGLIGDGDHGINMAKGFRFYLERHGDDGEDFATSLNNLGMILFNEIGGSMGPLYGNIFMNMSEAAEKSDAVTEEVFGQMLIGAVAAIEELGDAKLGDKTLMDVLIPARDAYMDASSENRGFKESLQIMSSAAIVGRDSTKDLVAKIGRASRLGERSRGVLDAGACSACLILTTFAQNFENKL
ncbi:MAG: dihydroxyacetone kinase subunit DhaL [Alphaproteobacteria bacterium]